MNAEMKLMSYILLNIFFLLQGIILFECFFFSLSLEGLLRHYITILVVEL